MKGWELFRTICKNASFERRQFAFFIIILAAAVSIYLAWPVKPPNIEASVEFPKPEASYSSQVTMEVEVTRAGQVYIDSRKNNQALKFYDTYDELRINVFNSPGYFVEHFQATVRLPENIQASDVRQLTYAVHGVGSYDAYVLDKQTLIYKASEISPQATLTIVAYLPKGMIKPSFFEKFKFTIEGFSLKIWFYVAIILPGLALILMTFMIFKRRSGQIFSLAGEFLREPPSDDPPAMVEVLVEGTMGARAIAATLIDLARRGFIFFINKDGDFSFGRRKSGDFESYADLKNFEKALLSKIFLAPAFKSNLADVEMRIGRHIFSRRIAQFYLDVYNLATRQDYFVKNPAKVHLVYRYLGVFLFFASFLGFILTALSQVELKFSLFFWVGGMLAAAFIIRLAPYMPARTAKGTEALKKWLAFRKFLTAKKSLSAKDVLLGKFDEYLPYAIVLGTEVEWAKHFGQESFAKPDWYESEEQVVTLENFAEQLFPFIGFVGENLAKSHEPTVE